MRERESLPFWTEPTKQSSNNGKRAKNIVLTQNEIALSRKGGLNGPENLSKPKLVARGAKF